MKANKAGETQLRTALHKALRLLGSGERNVAAEISRLLFFEQLCSKPTQGGRQVSPSVGLFLKRSLRQFRVDQPAEAELLERRFVIKEGTKQIARDLVASQEQVNRSQQRALRMFAAWILERENEAAQDHIDRLTANLPPAGYDHIFGATEPLRKLRAILKSKRKGWVVSLTGLGGIGKTAIVDSAIRSTIPDFAYKNLIWIRASGREEQPMLPEELITSLSHRLLPATLPSSEWRASLRSYLKKSPTLVVLDNLNAELSRVSWVHVLNDLANPSRFVLTSRKLPAASASVYVIPVAELTPKQAMALMLDHAKQRGLEKQLSIIKANAVKIYARTGGHPLALKLFVGLLHVWSLTETLDAIKNRQGQDIEAVYVNIYWASWHSLSRDAKRLLLAMPLVGETGANVDQLQGIAGLSKASIKTSVEELRRHSLLELFGNGGNVRYGIHHLTHTFLTSEVLKW